MFHKNLLTTVRELSVCLFAGDFLFVTRGQGKPLRRNAPNYKRGEKNRAKEGCETKRQENVTFNETYEHHGEPEHGKS